MKKNNILFLNYELLLWKNARQWGYTGTYGIEEALISNNCSCLMINKHWINRAPELTKNMEFEQIWVEIVHNKFENNIRDFIVEKSKIRVALIFESLDYSTADINILPQLAQRKQLVIERLKYFTHAIVVDEKDADFLNNNNIIKSFWWKQAINNNYILDSSDFSSKKNSIFSGTLYGVRKDYLNFNHFETIKTNPRKNIVFEYIFNINQIFAWIISNYYKFNPYLFFKLNMKVIKFMRKKEFVTYLNDLSNFNILINLPSIVKAYPGRVIEGMAAGCVVITQKIENRFNNNNIFKENEEIILYDTPISFRDKYLNIFENKFKCDEIRKNTFNQIKLNHTLEKRVEEFLAWQIVD